MVEILELSNAHFPSRLTAKKALIIEQQNITETQQGRNSCPRLQFGFQFGLYRVIAPLSLQRSISLASLFTC